MSFGAGFATGVFKSLDIGLQKSREREKDFEDDLTKMSFEKQLEEKEEWDDEVEEAEKALKNAEALFQGPDGTTAPNAMYYAASALKRSGSVADFNAFISTLKEAKATGVNPMEYFEGLPEDYQVYSAEQYAKSFVGKPTDFSTVKLPSSQSSKLLDFISGKPIDNSARINERINAQLIASGVSSEEIKTEWALPTLRFIDYKYNLARIDAPASKLESINNQLTNPDINKPFNADKKAWLTERKVKVLDMLRDTGNYETVRSTNVLSIQSLRGEISFLEKGGITREEQIKIDANNTAIKSLEAENDGLTDTINIEAARSEGNMNKVYDIEITSLLRDLSELDESNPNDMSKVNSIKVSLQEKMQQKFNYSLSNPGLLAKDKLEMLQSEHSRLLAQFPVEYADSQTAKDNSRAIKDLQRTITIMNLGEAKIEIYSGYITDGVNAGLLHASKSKFRKYWEADGKGGWVIDEGLVGNVRRDDVIDGKTGWTPDSLRESIDRVRAEGTKKYYDDLMKLWAEVTNRELFKAAENFYNNDGKNILGLSGADAIPKDWYTSEMGDVEISEATPRNTSVERGAGSKIDSPISKPSKDEIDKMLNPDKLSDEDIGKIVENAEPKTIEEKQIIANQVSEDEFKEMYPPTKDGFKKFIADKLGEGKNIQDIIDTWGDYTKLTAGHSFSADINKMINELTGTSGGGKGSKKWSVTDDKKATNIIGNFWSTLKSGTKSQQQANIVRKFSMPFLRAANVARKNNDATEVKQIIENAKKELMNEFPNISPDDAHEIVKNNLARGSANVNAKYFARGGLMARK